MEGRGLCGRCHLQIEAQRTCGKNTAGKAWPRVGGATKALVKSILERKEKPGGYGSNKDGGGQALCQVYWPMPTRPMDKVGGRPTKVSEMERLVEDSSDKA